METPVDQSPELHLEEIEPSDDSPGKTYRHTPSRTRQTEETKWMSTAWRVLYCVLCLLTVVAVWAVALLPSVLTYSIIRSSVPFLFCGLQIVWDLLKYSPATLQAPLEEEYTVNLTSTTLNCSIYTEYADSSGMSSTDQSILATESSFRNYSATAGSNCSRECSDGFYLHQELDSCRPQCGAWELTPSTAQLATAITSLCFATVFIVVDLVISALQWKSFTFPSFILVVMIFDTLAIVFFMTLAFNEMWFCNSVDLIDSLLNASPYCTLSGTVYSYSLHQLSLWAIFYMAFLFWAVICPFHYQSFRNAGRLKYVYTAMTIAGVLLPCVPAGVNLVFGHQVISFSPMVCLVAVQDVGFYTDALLGAFEVAILGTLQALVFWTLVKHAIEKTKKGKVALRRSRARRRILGLLLYILLLNILHSILSASVSATVNSTRRVLQDYLQCEATGRQAECSAIELNKALQTSENLVLAFLCVSALYPPLLLPFIVKVKELKKNCKHIHSLLRSCCVSKG